uniref:FAD-binding domain-containing protein n=1 Tax=Glycine max TaxID=3847 RepID=A0A0R0I0H3_SOYBN
METEEVVEDIVIVGAGIAGLTTSLGLHRHLNLISLLSLSLSHMLGIRSLVLESSDSLRVTGFALPIWVNAWKALDAVVINETKLVVELECRIVTTLVTGTQTSVMPFTETGNQQRDREIRCVKRKLLLEALANELPSGTIRYLSKVVAIVESGFYKILHLADGTTIKSKILIGFDGVNSVVAKWLGFKNASFTGRYSVRGFAEVQNNHRLEPRFLVMGRLFTDKELEDNPTKLKEYVLNTLEKMPSDVRYYIEKIKLDVFLLAPLGYRHPWELMFGNISKGNACVGGDAFHPMTPDLGQGGCCALEDGVVLSGCLAEAFSKPSTHIKENDKEANQYRRIEESLKKYANERRWRSIDVNATTYMVGYIQDNMLATFLASQYSKKSGYDCGKLNSS